MWGPAGRGVVRLALDTGATRTVVGWSSLVPLGYDPAATQERVQITTGSGVEYAPKITIGQMAALGQTRQGFPVLCHTMPPSATVDGVLGLDFFQGTRLVTDFREGVVTLE
ncbi:MAG: retropepsin-like domain-containing protein [Chloroflexi bacterium]|nr:retropepsin-like domain-containing protein [Chloroflexota bacterium]